MLLPKMSRCGCAAQRAAAASLTPHGALQAEKQKAKSADEAVKKAKVKSKKSKDAAASSPRQSPRLAAAIGSAAVPAIDIGKKRKAEAAAEAQPAVAAGGSKSGSRAGAAGYENDRGLGCILLAGDAAACSLHL